MLPYLGEGFGNPNSLHSFGAFAWEGVERARAQVAALLGAEDPRQIIFTSGATESNNWIAHSFATGAVSPFEHSAMREPALHFGYATLGNDKETIHSPREPVDLVSVMWVNNETGTIWEPRDYGMEGAKLHSDITQGLGKLKFSVAGLDYVSFSAHKFYGPKGVGGLYFADEPPPAMFLGGEQEMGHRSGTLNVASIVGLGEAAELAQTRMAEDLLHAQTLRNVLMEGFRGVSDWQLNGGDQTSPYILSISFLGVHGETVVIEADREGFAISSGAACSSRSTEPSHVLQALGVDDRWIRGTVRISFGRCNNVDSSAKLAKTLPLIVEKLRTVK